MAIFVVFVAVTVCVRVDKVVALTIEVDVVREVVVENIVLVKVLLMLDVVVTVDVGVDTNVEVEGTNIVEVRVVETVLVCEMTGVEVNVAIEGVNDVEVVEKVCVVDVVVLPIGRVDWVIVKGISDVEVGVVVTTD